LRAFARYLIQLNDSSGIVQDWKADRENCRQTRENFPDYGLLCPNRPARDCA
jgi:hypothetical protein